MQIKCTYVSTRFNKPEVENKIAVYRPLPGQEVEGDFVAKGKLIPLDAFVDITFDGVFVDDNKGREPALVVKSYTTQVRKTRASVLGYLSSGAVKGIGPATAKLIVDQFSLDAVEILESDPGRLREIKGIGDATLAMILESFEENRDIHSLMLYLGQFDISVNKARRIVKTYGARSLETVRGDIYNLCDVDGFGFLTVDDMAFKMKLPMNTLLRVKAAAVYLLGENREKGHLHMEPDQFLKTLKKMLNQKETHFKFSESDLRPLANEVIQSEQIVYNSKCIYLRKDLQTEAGFAALMARRLARDRMETGNVVKYPQIVDSGFALSPEQEKAVIMALTHNTCIITGGPGTGKTTVLKTFLNSYAKQNKPKDAILLCAPTGRAARRMSEATGYGACTIHKAFGLGSEDDPDSENTPRSRLDTVVMDEFSMSDMWLSFKVLSSISVDTRLVIVGDADQLPSVGPGNVLHELLQVEEIPRVQLEQVFRQSEGSAIAKNARRIAKRNTDLIYDDSFMLVPASDQKEGMRYIRTLYQRATAKLGTDMVQILTPMRKRGECSVNSLNTAIQKMVQEDPEDGKKVFDRYFCEGDPVIQNKNKNGVNNGDMGTVSETSPGGVKVSFAGLDLQRRYDDETLRMLELAYALTVHKSQGSEYPVVIMPVLREHSYMLTRNLFYTAITRGKKRVVLVGQESAIKKAILKEDTTKRRTLLALRIRAALKKLEGEHICTSEETTLKQSA